MRAGIAKLGLLSALLCVTACGFHPIYGSRDDGTPVVAAMNDVGIDTIPDRNGQVLRNNLIDRMYHNGRPQHPKYDLSINMHQTEEGIGLLPNATTSLTELNVYADYVMKDNKTGKVVVQATAHAVATYNLLTQSYGTLAANENANRRCIDQISDEIVSRLSLYFSEGTVINPPPPEEHQQLKLTP